MCRDLRCIPIGFNLNSNYAGVNASPNNHIITYRDLPDTSISIFICIQTHFFNMHNKN